MIRVAVKFHGAPPTVDLILSELARRTGLPLTVHAKLPNGASFSHPEFVDCFYAITVSDCAVAVMFGAMEVSYLLWALFSTLNALGGCYDSKIPEYAHSRWHELADLHDKIRYAR